MRSCRVPWRLGGGNDVKSEHSPPPRIQRRAYCALLPAGPRRAVDLGAVAELFERNPGVSEAPLHRRDVYRHKAERRGLCVHASTYALLHSTRQCSNAR